VWYLINHTLLPAGDICDSFHSFATWWQAIHGLIINNRMCCCVTCVCICVCVSVCLLTLCIVGIWFIRLHCSLISSSDNCCTFRHTHTHQTVRTVKSNWEIPTHGYQIKFKSMLKSIKIRRHWRWRKKLRCNRAGVTEFPMQVKWLSWRNVKTYDAADSVKLYNRWSRKPQQNLHHETSVDCCWWFLYSSFTNGQLSLTT